MTAVAIKFRRVFSMGIGMIEVDPQSGTLRPANRRTAERLGLLEGWSNDPGPRACRRKVIDRVDLEVGAPARPWIWLPVDCPEVHLPKLAMAAVTAVDAVPGADIESLRALIRDGLSLAARLRKKAEASRAQTELSRLYLDTDAWGRAAAAAALLR
jgi:hypothetical protein